MSIDQELAEALRSLVAANAAHKAASHALLAYRSETGDHQQFQALCDDLRRAESEVTCWGGVVANMAAQRGFQPDREAR